MTMDLPMDTNMDRYEKPVQTPVGGGGGAIWPNLTSLG